MIERNAMAIKDEDYKKNLIRELMILPTETEWVEFKVNKNDPQMIGEYISALSNSATLVGRTKAYLIWGIEDEKHKIVGTDFDYRKSKKGAEELEAWLTRMLNPRVNFKFSEVEIDNKKVVILEISAAEHQPTKFSGEEYIRIGSNKKNLKEFPNKERELWRFFDTTPYELKNAKENVSKKEVLDLLDYFRYYEKMEFAIPKSDNKIIDDFINEKFIKKMRLDYII